MVCTPVRPDVGDGSRAWRDFRRCSEHVPETVMRLMQRKNMNGSSGASGYAAGPRCTPYNPDPGVSGSVFSPVVCSVQKHPGYLLLSLNLKNAMAVVHPLEVKKKCL